MTGPRWEPEGFATPEAWRQYRDSRTPQRQLPTIRRDPEPTLQQRDCLLCEGSGWVTIPDPLFRGTLVDCHCPACEDLTVRAERCRWEMNDGRKVGSA